MKRRSGFYMMGTKAFAKLGDISRDEPDLCIIFGKMRGYYIGNWVTGFGFIDVKFPIATTRYPTRADKKRFNGRWFGINGTPLYQLKIA